MSESIDNLLNTGVIEEHLKLYLEVISPLGVVPKKNNKLRLILYAMLTLFWLIRNLR